MTTRQSAVFRASADVLTRLGEELITDSTQALLELIKNAYDADARSVVIDVDTAIVHPSRTGWVQVPVEDLGPDERSYGEQERARIDAGGEAGPDQDEADNSGGETAKGLVWLRRPLLGRVRLIDNGHGLDSDAIRNGWLTLSASPKRASKRRGELTARKRTPLGDKGLGRLGAQRLGEAIELRTRPTRPPGRLPISDERKDPARAPAVEHRVGYAFADFDPTKMLDDISIDWTTADLVETIDDWPLKTPWGTVLDLWGLRDPADWDAHDRIATDVGRLVDPFSGVHGFRISLTIDGDPLNVGAAVDELRKAAMHRWTATFDGERLTIDGRLRAQHFRPRERELRDELEVVLSEDGGEGLVQALAASPRLTPFSPEQGENPYLVAVHRERALEEIGVEPGDDPAWWRTSPPGSFSLELDSVALQLSIMRTAELTRFAKQKEYRNFIGERAGVFVYRDGFRVAGGEDLLSLGKAFSSGGSYYGLRPANVLGAVKISAAGNGQLEETTDREGLRDTAAARAFRRILAIARDEINAVLDEAGRAAGEYLQGRIRERANTDRSIEELSDDTEAALERSRALARSIKTVYVSVSRAASSEAVAQAEPEMAADLQAAARALDDAGSVLGQLNQLPALVAAMREDVGAMRGQLQETYQLVGLGLVAESLAHELAHSVRRLRERSRLARPMIAAIKNRDPELDLYVEEVDQVARSLRLQLRHLDPQLRYAREQRRSTDLAELVRDSLEFHRDRLRDEPIDIRVTADGDAMVKIVPGRVMQIIDNLVFNAEFWVGQHRAKGNLERGEISAHVAGPSFTISDNGAGVDPGIAAAIFEPFVSGREQGRGLGLFICRQLADAEHGTLELVTRPGLRSSTFRLQLPAP